MDLQLAIICALTFVIHVIGTLAYSVNVLQLILLPPEVLVW